MVLNNMKSYLKLFAVSDIGYQEGDDVTVNLGSGLPIIDTGGSTISSINLYKAGITTTNRFPLYCYDRSYSLMTKESLTGTQGGYSYFMFGSGNSPVTENDYCLENPITGGLSIPSSVNVVNTKTAVLSDDGNSFTKKVSLNIDVKNTKSSSIAISEVGFYEKIYYNGTTYKTVLMHREVFDTPVTIEAGAYGTFEFEFTFTTSFI